MVENFVKVSAHAADRMMERFGFESIDVKQQMAERAWKNGKTYREYSGKTSRYLYDIEKRHSSSDIVVKNYSGKLFVFNTNGVLCTAYEEDNLLKKHKSRLPIFKENTNYNDAEYENYYAA